MRQHLPSSARSRSGTGHAQGPDLNWVEIQPLPDSVPVVRHMVRRLLSPAEPAFIHNAELVTSELVTNAIRCVRTLEPPPYHADPAVLLAVQACPRWVHLRVRDPYPQALPARKQADVTDTSGRGLLISETVADHLWVEVGRADKTVHAVLARQGVTLTEADIAGFHR